MKRLQPAFKRLQAYVEKPWFEILLSFLAFLDVFAVVIPTDGLVVSSTLLCGQKWWRFAIWTTIGSSLGGLVFAFLVQDYGLPIVTHFLPNLVQSSGWEWTDQLFTEHGLWVLFFIAASPIMQQPAIALAVLAHHTLGQILLIMFMGRLLKYMVVTYIARFVPNLIERIWGFRRELHEMDEAP